MVQIRRPRDNFCAFETLSKMADLKSFFALMKKRQSFCYPTVQTAMDWLSFLEKHVCEFDVHGEVAFLDIVLN
jgi:hypothetical protein